MLGFINCFPELKESEDEKKPIWHNEDEEPQKDSLILLIMQSGTPIVAKIIEPNHTFNHGERWAYIDDLLEKQDEKKPSSKIEPKFKIGDIVKHKNNPHLTYILKRFTDDGDYEFHAIGKDGNEGGTCFAVVKYQDEWELVEQNQTWSKEDEIRLKHVLRLLDVKDDKKYLLMFGLNNLQDLEKDIDWLKSLSPQNNITDEELAQAKKDAYNDALNKIEYHSGDPTFDDGWSAAIWYLKKRNIRLQSQWKPSDKQLECLGYAIEKAEKDWTPLTNNRIYLTLKALKEQLLELKGSKV